MHLISKYSDETSGKGRLASPSENLTIEPFITLPRIALKDLRTLSNYLVFIQVENNHSWVFYETEILRMSCELVPLSIVYHLIARYIYRFVFRLNIPDTTSGL